LNLTEPYSSILADAKEDFHSSADATITIDSHDSGEEIDERRTNLYGTIESGQVAITKFQVLVNSNLFSQEVFADIGYDGDFYIEIPVDAGVNHLQFVTNGLDSDSNLITLPNNMATEDFTLVGAFDYSVILITLTWDREDTDVDLYVIDPTGDASWYSDKYTNDGGELDIDITSGFGPEHWTLDTNDTIRWSEDYVVRLHYFSDHDNGPTNYTVSVMMYEGTDREFSTSYTGNLSANDSDNDDPGDVGADWRDIVVLTPTQGGDNALLKDDTKVPSVSLVEPGYVPVIRESLPSRAERLRAKLQGALR
jgi:uncharacterized protein YfaP (DUF2135 family)